MENISYEELMSYFIPLAKAIIIFIVGWVASKWANRITYSLLGNFDPSMRGFLAGVVQYTVLAATVIASMEAVGVKTTSLVAVLASAGLAVGMALQGSLANFASGIMILIFRPFKLGDKVTAGGQTGAVMDIGIFATTLKNPILDTIIIPNSAVTSSCITNHTVKETFVQRWMLASPMVARWK